MSFDNEEWFKLTSWALRLSLPSLWDFDIDTDEVISVSETFYYLICLRIKIKNTFRILTPFKNGSSLILLFFSMFFPLRQLFPRWTMNTLVMSSHLKNCFPIYHLIIFPCLYSRFHDSRFTNEYMNALTFSTRQVLGASTDPMVPESLVFMVND